MTDANNSDSVAVRWAGIGVAVSGFLLVVTIGLYGGVLGGATPSEPNLAVTIADQANHLASNWGLAAAIWVTEVGLFVVLATSAVVMVTESCGGAALFPKRAAWASVSVGAILQAGMYSFMLGGYPAAMSAVQTTPALFASLNGSAFFLFYLGNAAIFLGFAGLYLTEGSLGEVVSRRVGWIGSTTCVLGMILLVTVATGRISIVVAAPFALLAHLFIGYFGVALYRLAGDTAQSAT